MGIRNHQLHATQPATRQALEKARPERLGLRGTDMQPDDLPLAVGVHRHSDYRSHRDDAPTLTLLQVGRVQPEIRPLASQRTVKECMNPLVNLLAQLRDLRLADPR
jgi:hypothetical protein